MTKFVVSTLLFLTSAFGLSAQTVSTKPPKDYASAVAPLLTPLEKVLEATGDPPKEAEHGWILLDEVVHHIRPNGSRMIVRHQICRAISQNGAEGCGRDVTGYRLSSQTPHVVLARSIQPDGRRQDVRADARFLQTPQREADYDLYNDSGEVVIIFPNVKPGTLTEYIVVIDEAKPRIPGHYSSYFGFQFGWPARLIRATAEMPAEYATRLITTPLGRGVPEGKKETLPKGGRQRWTWEVERTSGSKNEPASPSFTQSGPLVRLTTLKDWAELVDWYRPLVEKRFVLGKKLEAEVTRWTEQATTPREILDILHNHAANDVRYVGLEFGSCDIEPHPASEVWEHQYGDCKDKASLLAAMLHFKGLSAHLVLVNTSHLGRVERRSPDYRDFNHAILVADLPDGPVFCDPTVEGSTPGMLSPSDADRDVLVISKPERWMRTPPQDAGTFALNFDAKLSATGELSGWATLESLGYYAVRFRSMEATSTRQQLKDRLKGYVAGTWPGANVIDIKTEESKPGQPHRIQAYFIQPSNGSPTLRFPFDESYLPNLGDGEDRVSDAYLLRDLSTTTSTITLPPGFRTATIPPPLNVTHEHGQGGARWNLDGSKLHATLSYQTKSSRLPAAQVESFMDSVNTLRAWLDKPVTLEAADGAAPVTAASPDALADFPRMPSGEGQLDLVAERYPMNGDLKLRRAAYEKTITFFPKDPQTQFLARAQIAYIDQREDNHPAAIRLLRGILEAQKGSVPAEDSALAEYLLALSLKETKEEANALALLDAIVVNKQVSTFRRAWCHALRSQLFDEKEPEKALQAAQDGLSLENGDVSALLNHVCLLHARLKQETALRATLEKFIARDTPETAQMLTSLATMVDALAAEKPAEASLIVKALAALGKDAAFGKDFDTALTSARVRVEAQGVYGGIQEKLKAWLAVHPAEMPEWKVPDTLKTPEDFTQAIEKALKRENFNHLELTRLALESLTRFEPGPWYGERLWKSVSYIELLDRKQITSAPPPLMLHLLDLCDATPRLSEPNLEGRYLRGLTLKRHGKLEEEAAIYRGLVAEPDLDGGYVISARDRLAENAIARGKPAEALEAWRGVSKHGGYYSVPTSLLKAVLLALETGDEKAAFEFLEQLRSIKESVIAKSPAAEHIQSFLKFATNDKQMREWWGHSAKWWPKWQEFEAKHLPKRDASVPLVPIIPSMQQIGQDYRTNIDAGRPDAAMDLVRLLGHAARWQPEIAATLAGMPAVGGAPLEKVISPFREVTYAIHAAGGFTDPENASTVLLWAAVGHIDGGSSTSALDLCREHHIKHGAKDTISIAILRIWGMAAARSGKDLDTASAALAAHLAGTTPDAGRHQTVDVLAGLYKKQNLRDKEVALLKSELDNPLNKEAGDALQPLRQRYEMLLEGGEGGDGPALAVKAWLAAHKPVWYDHVRPLDLKDEKAADPDEAIAPGNAKALSAPEAVKLCCLLAEDSQQPDQRRLMAIGYLGLYSSMIATDMAQFKAWMEALKDEKSLPRPARAMAVYLSLRQCFWNGRMHSLLQHSLAEPVLEHLRENLQPELASLRRYGRVGPHDLDANDAYAKELLQGTLDYLTVECLERSIQRLAEGGRFDQARAHYKAMATARYDEDTSRQKGARQLSALKAINAAKKLHPVHEALRAWFLASPLAKAAEGVKPVPEPFQASWDLDLPAAERLQLYRQWITAGTFPRGDLNFWVELATAFPRDEHQVKLALGMLTLALEKAPDDESCGDLIIRSPSVVDTDDLPTLAALETVLKPFRSRLDATETQDALRMHDLRMKLRQGADLDVFATLRTLQTPNRQGYARAIILTSLISRGDKAGTRRLIEMIDPGQLLGRGMIRDAYHAYRLLGMTDEAELAADQMRDYMQREMLYAWMMPHGDHATPIVHMALQLDEPALIPKAFTDYMQSALRDPHDKLFFQSMNGLLSKDWEQTANAATEATRLFPTFYDFYNHLGIAASELGRKEEAVKALTTFLKFDHNTIDAAKAKERLAKIQKDG